MAQRMQNLRSLLIANAGKSFSVREACRDLGIPDDQSKPVFSSFNSMRHSGEVSVKKGKCSVTGKTVKLYCWVGRPAQPQQAAPTPPPQQPSPPPQQPVQPPQPRPAPIRPRTARSAAGRAAKAQAASQAAAQAAAKAAQDAAFAKLRAEEQARIEARRRLVDSARAERERMARENAAKDALERAKRTFQALTGIAPAANILDEMKRAYRQAALRLHPDRGGDASKFSELSSSWSELERNLA